MSIGEIRTTNIELYCETMKCLKHLVDTTVTIIQSLEETKRNKEKRTDSKSLNEESEFVNKESYQPVEKPKNLSSKAICLRPLNALIREICSKTVEVILYESNLSKRLDQLELSPIFRINFYDLIVILAHAFKIKSQILAQDGKKSIQSTNLNSSCKCLQLNVQPELSDSLRHSFSIQFGNSIRLNHFDKLVEVCFDSKSVDIDRLRYIESTTVKAILTDQPKQEEDEHNMLDLKELNKCCSNKKIKKSNSFLVPDIPNKYLDEAIEPSQIKRDLLVVEPNETRREEIEATFTQNFDCSHLCFPQTQLNCSQTNNLDQVQSSQISSFQKCHSDDSKEDEQIFTNNDYEANGLVLKQNIDDVRKEELMPSIDEKILPNQFIEFVPIQPNETANKQDQLVPIIFTQCGTRIDCPPFKASQSETTGAQQLVPKSNEPNHDNERTKALKRRLFMRLGLSKKQKVRKHLHPSFD